MRSLRRLAVVAMALAVFLVQSVQAQVAKQLPADTLFVLKVSNLRQTSDKVNKLLNTLGVAQLAGIQDPLATVKQQMGINAGLREDGEAVFAYLDPTSTGVDEDESMLILLPVADYQAFLGNFEDAQTEGAVTSVRLQGSPTFVSQWGQYAALSPARQIVQSAPEAAMAVANALSKDVAGSDAIFYANFEKIRPLVLPKLQQAREEALRDAERELAGNEQQKQFVPVAKAAITQGFGAVEQLLNESNAGAISLNLTDQGIAINAIADFQPASELGKMVSSLKGTNESLVRGLPTGEYLVYGGWSIESDALVEQLVKFAGPILQAVAESQGKAAEGEKMLAATRQFYAAFKEMSFGWVAPTGQLGQEALLQMVAVNRGDAAAMRQASQAMAEAQGALFGEMMGGAGIAYTDNAKTIAGVEFDAVQVNLNLQPPAPAENETPEQRRARQRAMREAEQAQRALAVLYGPGGMTQYNALVGDTFLIASGVSDEVLGKLVESAKANTDLLAGKAHVQSVNQALPQQRIAALYIPLDQWAKTGAVYAARFNFPVQLQLPPDLPPIGVVVTTEGATLRVESYIPVDLIQSLIAAGLQAAGGAGMGGGMGDPDGL